MRKPASAMLPGAIYPLQRLNPFLRTLIALRADALEFLHWCSGVVVQISKVHAA